VCDERDTSGHLLYKCKCNFCGNIFARRLFEAKHSTRCKHIDKHWRNGRIGEIFTLMTRRCYNPNNKDYKWYGGKGIQICDEWRNSPSAFEEWALQNGYNDELTIDRINPDKDYCPENCQWIPRADNTRKAGAVTWITVDGKTLTGRQWADYLQIGTNVINTAIRKHGLNKTIDLIKAMLNEPPSTKWKKLNQSWFSVYKIQLGDEL